MGDVGVLNLSKKSFSQSDLIGYFNQYVGDKSKLHTLILDDNFVRHLDLSSVPVLDLLQISVARNQVTRIQSVQKFLNLRVINLSSNLLIQLDGIDHLKSLEWISVSGNQLSNVDILNKCPKLVHVDASDNQLTQLSNLKNLPSLHTLLLHRNLIANLKPASEKLPSALSFLSLADNEIIDLNQVKYLTELPNLYQLSLLNNPCFILDVSVLETDLPPINYRPFVINWCSNLTILDGLHVTQRENMKAEWLLSQGRGRSFDVGQHIELIKYLSSVSPVISCQDANCEEMKLEKVLTQKKQHGTDYASPPKMSGGISKRTSYMNDEKSSDLMTSQSRVPDHEKRKRIHAWLGEQSLDDQSSIHSAMLLPSGENNSTANHGVLPYNMSLLMSESEFVSGDDLPTDERKEVCLPIQSLSPKHQQSHSGQSNHQYTPGQAPHAAYHSLGLIRHLYDSPTKAHTPHSGHNPRLPSTTSTNENLSPSMVANPPSHVAKAAKDDEFQHSVLDEDVGVSMSVSKYEEYEMRPIKPLNSDLQKKIYGHTASSGSNHPKPRPQPLKKNTGSTSKHSVTRLRTNENTSIVATPLPITRKQSNLITKKQSSPKKESAAHKTSVLKPVTLSYHRKRQQHQHSSKEPSTSKNAGTKRKKLKDAKSQSTKQQDHVDSDVESNRSYTIYKHGSGNSLSQTQVLQTSAFPTDLRHVMAATKIQAAWRGFRARWRNLKVLEKRQELRARRSEQYISLLCNELQGIKEKQESEKRMRELQTEAIRFMWTQIRSLHEKVGKYEAAESGKKSTKSTSPELSRSKKTKTSPRRTPRVCFPLGGSRTNSPKKNIGRHAYECESMFSTTCDEESVVPNNIKKKADASWKDDMEESLPVAMAPKKKSVVEMLADDTDEGRGSLTTDVDAGEGSSKSKEAKENNVLKQTVEQLQKQVLQLQDALLSFSDRLVASENEISNSKMNVQQEELLDDSAEEKTSLEMENSVALSETVCVKNDPDSLKLELNGNTEVDSTDLISARQNSPKMTVQEILTSLDSALTEKELWSLCSQTVIALQSRTEKPVGYLSMDTTCVHNDGVISFSEDQDVLVDDIYLAPELCDQTNSPTVKSSVFGLSVTLWSAADYKMEENQAPCLSKQFEDLLVLMSHDDQDQRAELEHVTKLCEEYHSQMQCNSLEVCASLLAEARDFKRSKKRSLNSTVLMEVLQEEVDGRKSDFRSSVVPHINDCSFQLKPVTARELPPKPKLQQSLHEQLMDEVKEGGALKNCTKPRVFTVKDLFEKDPDLLNKLNILPGQRRKNMKAMQLALRRQQPQDPGSPPRTGVPTPPRALRAEVRQVSSSGDNQQENESCSVILRWHPAHVYDKQGNDSKSDKIIGYRINVNGQPRGMVAGNKTRALLDGLRRSCEYRVNIRAISALGESDISNTVIVYIATLSDPQISSNPVNLSGSFDKFTATGDLPMQATKKQPNPANDSTKSGFKLGAVFPNTVSQQITKPASNQSGHTKPRSKDPMSEAMQTTSSNDSWTTAMSPEFANNKETASKEKKATSSDDIVDRVLRRYGIQKATTSTLPPITGKTLFPAASRSIPDQLSNQNDHVDDESTSTMSEGTQQTSGASSAGENITPRSKALLDQLKDELLN